jgi:hypothetical protein
VDDGGRSDELRETARILEGAVYAAVGPLLEACLQANAGLTATVERHERRITSLQGQMRAQDRTIQRLKRRAASRPPGRRASLPTPEGGTRT